MRFKALFTFVVLIPGVGGLQGCGCDGVPSCVLGPAVQVTVRAAGADGAIDEATVEVITSSPTAPVSCSPGPASTTCRVLGYPGTYDLVVKAPGFLSESRAARVEGKDTPCGCPVTRTEDITVTLWPAP
jgi:hypothetical protein